MIGYPKTIATKADVENLLAIDVYKTRVLADIQMLLDERYDWILQGQLDVSDTSTAESGHKIVDITDETGSVTQKYLYKWGATESNALTRMGVTVAEAVAWGCEDRVIEAPE